MNRGKKKVRNSVAFLKDIMQHNPLTARSSRLFPSLLQQLSNWTHSTVPVQRP